MKKTEKHQKKTFTEAHTATKKGWVMVLFILFSLFLVGTVSAADWDNKLYYSENDLKVTIKNSFLGLFPTSEIGIAELKSHSSVNYVKKVGAGNQVVMWYDFNFVELYLNGLGNVEFTNIRTGELIDRDYSFVYWGEKERNIYETNCYVVGKFVNGSAIEECNRVFVRTKTYEDWLPYNSQDIPKENIRIGLMTYVEVNDNIDGVWTIAGKKVKKHAEWTANLNVGLLGYWKFDGDVLDSLGINNGTDYGTTDNLAGIINQGRYFDGDYVDFGDIQDATWNNFTFNVWVNYTGTANEIILGKYYDGSLRSFNFVISLDTSGGNMTFTASMGGDNSAIDYVSNVVIPQGALHMMTVTYEDPDLRLYLDGVNVGNYSKAGGLDQNAEEFVIGGQLLASLFMEGVADELSISLRGWTGAEVFYVFNNGVGMSWRDVFDDAPTISLTSPIDTFNSTSQTIVFNGTVYDDFNLINVSLYIDGILNETNATGINNTNYIFTRILNDGDYNWTYNACDNASGKTTASTRYFNINTAPIINITFPLNQTYTTSLINFNATSSLPNDAWIINYNGTNITIFNSTLNINLGVKEGSYHLLLYANNSVSGVWGLNDTIYFAVELTEPVVALISPEDNLGTENTTFLFEANTTAGNYTLTNATIYVWYNNEMMQSETNNSVAGTYDANVSFNLSGFSLGVYKWNVQVNYENTVLGIHNSVFATNNRTLNIEAILSSITYNNNTYETKIETFAAEFDIVADSEISLAQLVYNGTNYTITNLTTTSTTLMLQKAIDIPFNLNTLTNETKSFFFRFTYGGGFIQETDEQEQNVSFINFQQCNTTYPAQSLNFTFFNEINQTNINATANPVSFESNWKYWIGSGGLYKTYTFQNLSSSLNNYQFCLYPYRPNNYTFRINGDIDFSATAFRENEHHLRNATLTNVSNDVLLYLLHTDYGTKFFLTFKQGTTLIEGATITIQKYFTGLGEFKTVGIQFSDDNGEATMWGEVDKIYKFFIVKDSELLGIVERNAICAVAPCTLSIIIEEAPTDLFEAYYETFVQNIVSTLGYNKTSKIITYSFVDTTGLANYFRLKVQRVMLNETKDVICNSQSFSTAGTLTCNLTGKSGEFKATTYVSRSPELIDKVLSVITDDDVLESLGLMGIFLVMALLITIVFAAAIIGRGSPSVVLWALAASIVLLKLAHLFPFTWAVVITLEVIIFFLISQVKN